MALLDSSRQAWLAAPGSGRHDVESSGSSASLLHSIYGSQASQLPISDYGSESSWGRSQTELAGAARSLTSLPRRPVRSRPMSSPASVLAARQAQRRALSGVLVESPVVGSSVTSLEEDEDQISVRIEVPLEGVGPRRPARPYSAAVSSARPSRLARGLSRPPSARMSAYPAQVAHHHHQGEGRRMPRPQSAAVAGSRSSGAVHIPQQSRPPSAVSYQRRQRPRTALATSRRHQESLALVDLEEEPEESLVPAPPMRDTAPVHVTNTPEYFNFWLGKPLQERDFGVKVQKRKPWKRPQSDYGNRFGVRRKSDTNEKGSGADNDQEGDTSGLGTLLEEDGSTGGNRGRRSESGLSGDGKDAAGIGKGDGKDGKDGGGSTSRTSSTDSSRRKSKDHRGTKGRGRRKTSSGSDKSDKKGKKILWDSSKNFSKEAEEDDYFKDQSLFKDAIDRTAWVDPALFPSVKPTRFELPMDLSTLEGMTPLQYLTSHCIVGHKIRDRCSKIFLELDREKKLKLPKEKVKKGLIKVFWSLISADEAEAVLELVLYPPNLEVTCHLFSCISCVARRVLCLYDKSGPRKELIETVDFESLSWKFRDYHIDKSLLQLFKKIE